MSVTRPPDFEPLAAADPVPGDPVAVAAIGRRYRDTAAEIAQQAANLRKLAEQASGGWKGKAGDVFRSHASDLAGRISKAQARYDGTGEALASWSGPLADAQDEAYAAVWEAKAAAQELSANAPGPKPPPGSPALTPQEEQQQKKRGAAYQDAQTSMAAARRKFDQAVGDYHGSAARAAARIHQATGDDGLKDSWWDRNFGWISTVMHVVAIIVIVLAIVAIVLACPLSAGFLAALLGVSASTITAAGTVIGAVLAGLTVIQLAFDSAAAATGKQSWTAAILDAVALATLGFGKLTEVAVRGLADGGLKVGQAVQAGRAGRASMTASGLPDLLYSLGGRSGIARTLIGLSGRAGDALDTALSSADGARTALATAVKGAEAGNLPALWTMSGGVAEDLAKLDTLATQVPRVLRIDVPRIAAQGFAAVDGYAQWTAFTGSGGYNIWSWAQESADASGASQAITTFRESLCPVP